MSIQNRIRQILAARKERQEYRDLSLYDNLIDFSSNDYLGLSRSFSIEEFNDNSLQNNTSKSGSTGSRLLSGNSQFIMNVEAQIAAFHNAEKALIFGAGFDANLGLISTVCRRGDFIIFDELVHASIRQGIKLSDADSNSFKHNDLDGLEMQLKANVGKLCFVVVESVYSMDGDKAPLKKIAQLKQKYEFELIVDEAHAVGVFGKEGRGLCELESIENDCFARIYTFGKALGGHGAAIVGSTLLVDYLINFCKPFIYTTAPSLSFVKHVKHSYVKCLSINNQRVKLFELIYYFNSEVRKHKLGKIIGEGPIFGIELGDANVTRSISKHLNEKGFDVRPIVYPTVARGSERIRICLHSFNSKSEIDNLLQIVKKELENEQS